MGAEQEKKETLSRSQQRRRDDIVQAALRVFDREGFEAARIEDVAREAQIAKGTVYLYFSNKDALLEGVIRSVVGPAIAAVENAASMNGLSASDRLRRQISAIGERLGNGDMSIILRLMIAEGPKHEHLRQFYYSAVVGPGMAAISRCLADGETSGEFRPGTSKLRPQVFAGTPLMAAIWRMLFDDIEALEFNALLNDHLATVLDGIRNGTVQD